MDNIGPEITKLAQENANIKLGTIKEAVDKFADNISELL